MLFNLKALAPALLLSAAAFAATVKSARDPGKKVQVSGIDVWSVPANISWKSIAADGIHFVYITATEGIGEPDSALVVRCTDNLFQISRTLTSPLSPPAPPTQAFFVVPTIRLYLTSLLVLLRQSILSPTVENGLRTASPSQVPLSWQVRVAHFQHPRYPNSTPVVYRTASAHTPVCYTLSAASMVSWIRDFSNTYHSSVGRYPVIHTTFDWWNECTDNYAGFGSTHPLWLYTYAGNLGLPAGWSTYTFFEDDTPSPVPDGSHDIFNGDISSLKQ